MIQNKREILDSINSNELDSFISKTQSSFFVKSNIKEINVDYSWIDVLENTLGSIDKIVRNPRRFIVQEEDLVIVEKAKKVGQQTIRNLAEHCENIQALDNDGVIIPKKLLNINKEDTTDLYENRFIYTLVKRLDTFINKQLENLDIVSDKQIDKNAVYKGNTTFDNKKVDIEVKMNFHEEINLNKDSKNIKNRILACYEIIKNFKSTEMIKELAGCSLVFNPIRKTNLILREPNFQKAFILWEYLDQFEFKDPKVVKYENIINEDKAAKDEFTLSYFINCNALDESKENIMKYKSLDSKLSNIINEYIYEDKYKLEDILNKVNKYYNDKLKQKNDTENNIAILFNNFIKNHKSIIENISNSNS